MSTLLIVAYLSPMLPHSNKLNYLMTKFFNSWELTKIFLLMSSLQFVTALYMVNSKSSLTLSWTILNLTTTNLKISLMLDTMSLMFSSGVLLISANILMFSQFYMMEEMNKAKFNQLVTSFIISMNILVFSGDLIFMLLGWDGLGMTSFLLVMYYQNYKSLGASMITLMTNRVGDALLLISIALTLSTANWDVEPTHSSIFSLPIFLLWGAAITKSAQVPFSAWLPEAMSAPTPVSALVHSSTLVTAGVFLMIRYAPLLYINNLSFPLSTAGTLTMLGGGLWGCFCMDTKKVVAFSTLSHLGIMCMVLASGLFSLCFLHLMIHAMFKALLFMCVGTDIMLKAHKQTVSPNSWSFNLSHISTPKLMSLISLNGIPFTSGFLSKDMIMESVTSNGNELQMALLLLSVSCSTIYSLRLWAQDQANLSWFATMSNTKSLHSFLPLTISTLSMSIMSISMGQTILNHNMCLFSCSQLEHLTPLMSVLLGGMIFHFTKIYTAPNHFMNTLMLQKPLTKSLSTPSFSLSLNTIKLTEMGMNWWLIPSSSASLITLISNYLLSQQSSAPPKILLIMLAMSLQLWLLC